jgi:hypothetical protein
MIFILGQKLLQVTIVWEGKTEITIFIQQVEYVCQKRSRSPKFFQCPLVLVANLGWFKSSCGWSPTHLSHKIENESPALEQWFFLTNFVFVFNKKENLDFLNAFS